MPALLRMLANGIDQEIQLHASAPVPRVGEIIETNPDDPGAEKLEVTEVRYILAGGTLNAVIECRAPSVGLANQGSDIAR
jgi:hypothetical protein